MKSSLPSSPTPPLLCPRTRKELLNYYLVFFVCFLGFFPLTHQTGTQTNPLDPQLLSRSLQKAKVKVSIPNRGVSVK